MEFHRTTDLQRRKKAQKTFNFTKKKCLFACNGDKGCCAWRKLTAPLSYDTCHIAAGATTGSISSYSRRAVFRFICYFCVNVWFPLYTFCIKFSKNKKYKHAPMVFFIILMDSFFDNENYVNNSKDNGLLFVQSIPMFYLNSIMGNLISY